MPPESTRPSQAWSSATTGSFPSPSLRPVSAGFAVPVFAFFAAGVTVSGGLASSLSHPVVIAIVAALVVGKAVGVFGGTYLVHRFTRASLDDDLAWSDVLGLSFLAGIGFTVSLLIGELAFEEDPALAALAAAVILRRRNTVYRRLVEAEDLDSDADGVPDVYSQG